MKRAIPPANIPHLGPVSPVKPPPAHQPGRFDGLRPALERIRDHGVEVVKSLATYKADALLLSGRERHSGESLKVFYFGLGENLAYLTELMYDAHETAEVGLDINPLRAQSWVSRYRAGVDLVVLDLPWPACGLIPGRGFLALPPWINMVIPLGDTWEAVVGRWARNAKGVDLRRIRKYQLTFRTTDSEAAFHAFYHSLYVPYVRKRFGAAAFIEPEGKIVSIHEFGEIIEVLREDKVIAAGILIHTGGSLGFPWTGMPVDVDPRTLDGAFAGLYYFIVRLAYERGCEEVNCFTNRPSLSDGVLRYKRKWGARLSGSDRLNGQILLQPVANTAAVRSLLSHNPFVAVAGGDFVGRVFFDAQKVSAKDALEAVDQYYTDGLAAMRLYALHGFEHDVAPALRERALPVELFDLHGAGDPLADFCRT